MYGNNIKHLHLRLFGRFLKKCQENRMPDTFVRPLFCELLRADRPGLIEPAD
jgi:hypothetical protein